MAETKHRTNWEKIFFSSLAPDRGSKVTNGCDVSSGSVGVVGRYYLKLSLVSAQPLRVLNI